MTNFCCSSRHVSHKLAKANGSPDFIVSGWSGTSNCAATNSVGVVRGKRPHILRPSHGGYAVTGTPSLRSAIARAIAPQDGTYLLVSSRIRAASSLSDPALFHAARNWSCGTYQTCSPIG